MKNVLASIIRKIRFERDLKIIRANTTKSIVRHPILGEDTPNTTYDAHYILFTLWALSKVKTIRPKVHYDIASTLSFVTTATILTKVKFFDIRPPLINVRNLAVYEGDVTNLPIKSNSITSLSCLHVIEHIGLGRYGDLLDINGDKRASKELMRVLAKGGNLLLAVPLGKSRIEFNAHRVYAYEDIIKMFSELKLKQFDYISEKVGLGFVKDNPINVSHKESYGCGCFWFTKKKN